MQKNCWTQQEIRKKQNKIVILATSKLNSIEIKISEALINNDISHENFMTIINEEKIIENKKTALEWWIVKEVIQKKLIWSKKVNK